MAKLVMIAAAAEDNSIGRDNQLLWHLPDDFRRFKRMTTGHAMIMGRKTFESFPKPLPDRLHIIVTRDPEYTVSNPQCEVVHSLEEAFQKVAGEVTAYIIGGGTIYAQAMQAADIIELTRVHGSFGGDTFFPDIDTGIWELAKEEYHPRDDRHAFAFTYRTFVRRKVLAGTD